MLNKSLLTLACTFALAGSVWADTPIGPGVTGSGGTGASTADAKVRDREGGGAGPKRQDGAPLDKADSNVRANSSAGASVRDESTGNAGTGSTAGASARGTAEGARINPEEAAKR
jgi:hypothetical protein